MKVWHRSWKHVDWHNNRFHQCQPNVENKSSRTPCEIEYFCLCFLFTCSSWTVQLLCVGGTNVGSMESNLSEMFFRLHPERLCRSSGFTSNLASSWQIAGYILIISNCRSCCIPYICLVMHLVDRITRGSIINLLLPDWIRHLPQVQNAHTF